MKKSAEEHAEEDKKLKKVIEAKNKAEHMVYTAEKAVKDAADKIQEDVKKDVESKIKELKELLKKEAVTPEELDKKVDELSESLQKVGQAAYQAQKPSEGAENDGTESGTAGDEKKKASTKDEPEIEEGEVVE